MALPWVAIAQMGVGLLSGYGQNKIEQAQYKAQRTLDKAEVSASNLIREANNELGAAQSSLSNWMRSVSNKRLITAAGEQYNAYTDNVGRMWDQSATGSLQRRIQASEQLGAIQASAAAAGVGGSTVDTINGTLKLRNAMLNAEIDKQEGQATYDQLMQRAGVMDNGYSQWDHSYDAANSSYMSAQMPIRIEPQDPGTSFMSNVARQALGLFSQPGGKGNELIDGIVNLFGGGKAQAGQGLQAPGRSYTTTPAGYTFMGLKDLKL